MREPVPTNVIRFPLHRRKTGTPSRAFLAEQRLPATLQVLAVRVDALLETLPVATS